MPSRVREGKHALQGKEGGYIACWVREGKTCPAGLGRGKHALVMLSISNKLLGKWS